MRTLCEDLKSHVSEILLEWEQRVKEEPWYSLPADHRINSLPDVIVALVEASLCNPGDVAAHRKNVDAAAEHGGHRRVQQIPEHLLFTEYHLLRQAIWYYLVRKFGSRRETADAIMSIDMAISVATNASMWGYHREEIEALGKWEEGIERIARSSALVRRREGG